MAGFPGAFPYTKKKGYVPTPRRPPTGSKTHLEARPVEVELPEDLLEPHDLPRGEALGKMLKTNSWGKPAWTKTGRNQGHTPLLQGGRIQSQEGLLNLGRDFGSCQFT